MGGIGNKPDDIWSKLNFYYRNYFLNKIPYFDRIRGTTRVSLELEGLSMGKDAYIDEEPTPAVEEDWDNLIILDACRYDLYKEVVGEGESRYSAGGGTVEFFEKNFSEGDYSDTVYISANPNMTDRIFQEHTGRKADNIFHTVYKTYETDWDEEQKTVMPQPVVRDAKNAEKLFPDKNKIIHFMQPHHPFVTRDFDEPGFSDSFIEGANYDTIWDMTKKGKVDHNEVVEAYKENLEYVMEHVRKLAEELEGKTVITSDHGNFVGEGYIYGHRVGSKAKALREVPWHIIKEK